MVGRFRWVTVLAVAGLVVFGSIFSWQADAATTQADPERLREELERLQQELEAQQRIIDALRNDMEELRRTSGKLQGLQQRVEKVEKSAGALGPSDFRLYWDKGIRLATADEAFKLKLGGRIMADWAWMQQDSDVEGLVGDLTDSTEFRRARFYMAGTIYENVDFKLQFDFAGGDADLKDAYIGLKGLPVYVKAGHFKEPFSLEEVTSSKYITFMERALPNVFSPGRNTGVQISDHACDKRLTWAAGAFTETDGVGESSMEEGWAVTGRVTGLPYYEEDGRKLLHLGAAASYRSPDAVRFRQRPEAHLAPRFVDTGTMATDSALLLGVESALVYGAASLQAELVSADADRQGASDADFWGGYIQASYFLTGEHRNYKQSAGAFSRVKPNKNFNIEECGWGAWELACRYSHLDLDDGAIGGGELDDVTVGLNWHLNPNTRVMWNYVRSDLDRGATDGAANILKMRLQVDF